MIQAPLTTVLFDMDGVLVDSAGFHARAFVEALADVELRGFEYASIAGMRTDDAVRALLESAGHGARSEDAAVVAGYVAHKRRRYAELAAHEFPLMPGAVSAVRALAADGVRLGLASSGSEASVTAFLTASLTGDVFQCVLHGETVQSAKPAPDIYLLAASRLGAAPAECLVVEDARAGVLAAASAGMRVAAFRPTPSVREVLRSDRDFVIESLGEVVTLARRLRS